MKTLLRFIFACALLCAIAFSAEPVPETAQSAALAWSTAFQLAEKKKATGDLAGAIASYTRAIELDATSAEVYFARGKARGDQLDFAGAIADYTRAIEINPRHNGAYLFRALARHETGDFAGAISDYTRTFQLPPLGPDADVLAFRGNSKVGSGDLDGAIADCTRALDLDPKNTVALSGRGYARLKKKDFDGAITDFTRALELDPKDAETYNYRGLARAQKTDLDGAIADYTRATELNPKFALAYHNRGIARKAKGEVAGAAADFEKAAALNPQSVVTHNTRNPDGSTNVVRIVGQPAGPTSVNVAEQKADAAVHVRVIQLSRTGNETDDALTAKAGQILARLKAGESFAELAKEFSRDNRQSQGGDWGWFKRSDLLNDFREIVFQLGKGEASAPMMFPEGCYIFYVEERRGRAGSTK